MLPAGLERAVEGHALADLERLDVPRRERTAEEAAVEDGHRPRPAVAHVGGPVEPSGPGPARAVVETIDLRQRQRAGVELAVVDGHPHDLLLLPSQPAGIQRSSRSSRNTCPFSQVPTKSSPACTSNEYV